MHIRGIRDIVVQEAILSKEPLIWHRAPVAVALTANYQPVRIIGCMVRIWILWEKADFQFLERATIVWKTPETLQFPKTGRNTNLIS